MDRADLRKEINRVLAIIAVIAVVIFAGFAVNSANEAKLFREEAARKSERAHAGFLSALEADRQRAIAAGEDPK